MLKLVEILFNPPPMPHVDLPLLPHRIEASVLSTLAEIFRGVYYRGVFDGVIAGVLVTLLFVPKIRDRILRESEDA